MFKTISNMLASANKSMERAQVSMDIKTLEAKRDLALLQSDEGYYAHVAKHYYAHVNTIRELEAKREVKRESDYYDRMLLTLIAEFIAKHPR